MKRFVIEVLIFGSLVLGVLAAAEIYVRNLPNPARDKHEWLQQHASQVETLVLGSSHTFYGVNPEWLGANAFSLAMVSQTYRYDEWGLKNYDFQHLKRIILPFSYFSLYEDYETGIGDDYISRYRIYMDCPLHSRLSAYNFEFMSFFAFKEKLKSLYRPQQMTWNELGWGSNYTLEAKAEDWDNGVVRAANNSYTDTSAVALNRQFLANIFSWCREHRVAVYWVSTPLTESYRMSRDEQQLCRNLRIQSELLTEFTEVHAVNFEADSFFVAEDFYDSDHLSELGARKLSQRLVEMMESR